MADKYQLVCRGDEWVSGPIVTLTDEQVRGIKALMGNAARFGGTWNSMSLVNVSERNRRIAAEEAKASDWLASSPYGEYNSIAVAFAAAARSKKAG